MSCLHYANPLYNYSQNSNTQLLREYRLFPIVGLDGERDTQAQSRGMHEVVDTPRKRNAALNQALCTSDATRAPAQS